MEQLAKDEQLMAYRHNSFWQCMDTLREKKLLESLWESGKAPWKIWEEEKEYASTSNGSRGVHRDGFGSDVAVSRSQRNGH